MVFFGTKPLTEIHQLFNRVPYAICNSQYNVLRPMFLDLFSFAAPFLHYKKFGSHPSNVLQVNVQQHQNLAATLELFHGTPVENLWVRSYELCCIQNGGRIARPFRSSVLSALVKVFVWILFWSCLALNFGNLLRRCFAPFIFISG